MKNFKKLLSLVLSMAMVASTLVLPMTINAATGIPTLPTVDESRIVYAFDDGTTQSAGSYTAGAIADSQATRAELSTVDGIGGKATTDKITQITRGATAGAPQIKVANAYAEILADSNKMTAEVQVYVPSIAADSTAGMSFAVYTNATSDSTGTVAQLGFNKFQNWSGDVKVKGSAVGTAWTETNNNTAGKWYNLAIVATKATTESSADGSFEMYVNGELVRTQTGLQIDKFYPDIRIISEYRSDITSCTQYYDNFRVYSGDYKGQYANGVSSVDESRIAYAFDMDDGTLNQSAGSFTTGGLTVNSGTASISNTAGIGGKFDNVAKIDRSGTGAPYIKVKNAYNKILTSANKMTAEVQMYVPELTAGMIFVVNTNGTSDGTAAQAQITFDTSGNWAANVKVQGTTTGTAWTKNIAQTAGKWHHVAVVATKATTASSADGKFEFYVDGDLVRTQTGLQINDFYSDIRVQSQYRGSDTSCAHYFDNLRVYSGDFAGPVNAVVTPSPSPVPTPTPTPNPHGVDMDINTMNGEATAGFAGKTASDKVKYTDKADYRPYSYGTAFDTNSQVLTYEAKVFVGETGSTQFHVYNGVEASDTRASLRLGGGAVSVGDGNNNVETIANVTYETNTWNKLAIVRDKTNSCWRYYLNGVLIETRNTNSVPASGKFAKDYGFVGNNNAYIDDIYVYTADYASIIDAPIAPVSQAVDGVITVDETATIDTVKGYVTDGTPTVYTSDLSTVSTTLATGDVLIINKGDLYKSYKIVRDIPATPEPEVVFGEWYFNESDVQPWADGVVVAGDEAGKLSGDKILKLGTQSGGGDVTIGTSVEWGATTGKSVSTLQFDVFVENSFSTLRIWPWGGNSNDRPGFHINTTSGEGITDENRQTVGITDGSGDEYNGTVMPRGEWVEFALEWNVTEGKAYLFMNGEVIEAVDYAGYKNSTPADIKMSFSNPAEKIDDKGTVDEEDDEILSFFSVYMDNIVWYSGGYEAGEYTAPEPPDADVIAIPYATGETYNKDGIDYVFVTVTTPAISDMSLYDTVRITDGTVVKEASIADVFGTSVTGAAEMGLCVMNVPLDAIDNKTFKVKYVLAN